RWPDLRPCLHPRQPDGWLPALLPLCWGWVREPVLPPALLLPADTSRENNPGHWSRQRPRLPSPASPTPRPGYHLRQGEHNHAACCSCFKCAPRHGQIRAKETEHLMVHGLEELLAAPGAQHDLAGIRQTAGDGEDLFLGSFHLGDPDWPHGLQIVRQHLGSPLGHVLENLLAHLIVRAL